MPNISPKARAFWKLPWVEQFLFPSVEDSLPTAASTHWTGDALLMHQTPRSFGSTFSLGFCVCENKWSTFQNPRINTWIPTTLEYVCHGILSTKSPNTNSELQWCKLQPMNMSSMKTTDQHLKDKCHSFKSPMWMESDPQSWYKPIFCSWEAKNESRIFQEKVTPLLHKIKVCIGLV